VILDPASPIDNERANKQCNIIALNTIYNGIDAKVLEQVKNLEKASKMWTILEKTYEGTTLIKSVKLYMLKDKLSNFKIKDDESIPEMFYMLQVIINDLKSLDKKVKDEDFSHKFLMCLPKKFKTLRTIIFRGGLTSVSLNEVLRDVITDAYIIIVIMKKLIRRMMTRRKKCGFEGIHLIQEQGQSKERNFKCVGPSCWRSTCICICTRINRKYVQNNRNSTQIDLIQNTELY
jgi:hypothetical protein